ncbi:MAG: GHKL domain-containing protein, partial [Bacteroidales bacterium]|nr:GHKL domain-containing protein [Bacteroidales bacterium]
MTSERLLHRASKYVLLVILMLTVFVAGYLTARSEFLAAVFFILCAFASGGLLMRIYDATNQSVAAWLNALQNNDTAVQYSPGKKSKSLAALYEGFNKLNGHFQKIREDSEINEKYYKALIRHSATGMLVLNGESVELINRTACNYAGISPDSTNPDLLRIKNPLFYEAVRNIEPGMDLTYKQVSGKSFQLLAFRATGLRKGSSSVKLVSIQDIRYELESRELESYRKLISVLTHEIMNLMSPLTSVSKALYALYHKDDIPVTLKSVDDQTLSSTVNGLRVFDEQTNAILNFVGNYRKIARIPPPEIKPFDTREWLEQLKIVYSGKMAELGVTFDIHSEGGPKTILADKNLINQVLINLISNAIEAVAENEESREIILEVSFSSRNRTIIALINNGPSIPPEIQEQIFVPFYTTKKNGSGIGLSICQEIMKLHKGSLTLISLPNS